MDVSSFDREVLSRYKYASNVPWHGLMQEGRPALTGILGNKIARYVLLTVRDPLCDYTMDPAHEFGARLEELEVVGNTAMFTTVTGTFKGVPVSIVSGGSGGPEVELALMDLFEHSNADTFIRVGGSGGMSPNVRPGDVVISTGVVRDEGTSRAYVPASYPAVCHRRVVLALEEAAQKLGVEYWCGITRSTDSDFVQSGRPAAGGFLPIQHRDTLDLWMRSGVLNGDRESSTIVTLANLYEKRAGSICSVADNIVTGEKFQAGRGHVDAMLVALEGIVFLSKYDTETALI